MNRVPLRHQVRLGGQMKTIYADDYEHSPKKKTDKRLVLCVGMNSSTCAVFKCPNRLNSISVTYPQTLVILLLYSSAVSKLLCGATPTLLTFSPIGGLAVTLHRDGAKERPPDAVVRF
eukprot:IDg3792t1